MEENLALMSNFSKETVLLFDKVCDTIVKEKGCIGDVEIEQLVSLLRRKIKKMQTSHSDSANRVPSLEEFRSVSSILSLEEANKNETMKALEDITNTMSSYLIHEKGTVIEKDIQDIANHLRIISSISNNNTKVMSNSYKTNFCALTKQKNSLKSVSETSVHQMKEKSNISRKQDGQLLYEIKKHIDYAQIVNKTSRDIKNTSLTFNKSNNSTISKSDAVKNSKLPRTAKICSLNLNSKQSRVHESIGRNSKSRIYDIEKHNSLTNQNNVHSSTSAMKTTSLIPSRIPTNISRSTSRVNSKCQIINTMNITSSSTSRMNITPSNTCRINSTPLSSSRINNTFTSATRMIKNLCPSTSRLSNTSSSTVRMNKTIPNATRMNKTCNSTSAIIKKIHEVTGLEKENEDKKCNLYPKKSVQVLKGATFTVQKENKIYTSLQKQSPKSQQVEGQAIADKTRKQRSKWVLDKPRFIFLKTDIDVNSSFKSSDKEVFIQGNDMNEDDTEKISKFFHNIVNAILLEKLDIKENDVDTISRTLNKYACTRKKFDLPQFNMVTTDMPVWALRGFIKKNNSVSVMKMLQPLLNKMVDFVVYLKEKMMPSDIKNFCTILRNEIPSLSAEDSQSKSFSINDTKVEKQQINLKDEQPETCSISLKQDTNTSKIHLPDEKSIALPHHYENVASTAAKFRYDINPHPSEQNIFVDVAIEDSIRSLEYIKRLTHYIKTEELLDNLDSNSKGKDSSKRLSLTKIHQKDQVNNRIPKSANAKLQSDRAFKKNNSDNIFQETTESIKKKIQNIKNNCKRTYFSLKEIQESCTVKEKNRNSLMSTSPGKHKLTNKTIHLLRESSKQFENKGNSQENPNSARQKSFASSNKNRGDVKKSIKPLSTKGTLLLPTNHSSNQLTRLRQGSQRLGEDKFTIKTSRKADKEQKENMIIVNTDGDKISNNEINDNDDKQSGGKECSQKMLKSCRTYSIFRPFHSKEIKKNTVTCSIVTKENENHPNQSTDLNQKRVGTKIPVSTIYQSSVLSSKK